jgi:ectoine hydroxylase-related dioxygenase (phytanoyl-CoA dioxygenase family)
MVAAAGLMGDYEVTPEQATDYRKNGHALLRGVAAPEVAARYKEKISAAVKRLNAERRPMEERDTYGKAFLQTMNLWLHDEAVKEFVFARRFAKLAADLMGVPSVRLYHDQALYKEPGGGPTPWHQDQYYWPLDTPNTITMWMPLVDITPDMGVMAFASGSQKDGYISSLEISDASESHFRNYITERKFSISQPAAMRAGDATFHSGWTLHNATPNTTGKMREVMTIIYFADGARVCEPDNPGRVKDLATWLPGCKVGETAASKINPVLYP